MAEFSKLARILGTRLPQRGLALSAAISLAAMLLAFAPVLPHPAFWQMMAVTPAQSAAVKAASPWAGHLESPAASQDERADGAPLTSASYTTGFDKEAAGLAPARVEAPPAQPLARDPNACPDNLNCTFRTKPVAALPPRRPAGVDLATVPPAQHVAAMDGPPAQPKNAKKPHGLTAFLPRLPSAHVLLKPFAFVADTFNGFMKKL